MLTEHRFADHHALTEGLSAFCRAQLQASLAQHPALTLLLSGGSTPAPFYQQLGQLALPWERLHLALVDERWVGPDHPASNERMLRTTLGPSAAARLTGMYEAGTPGQALPSINQRYGLLPRPWTLGLLGMGTDGHTASLFPQAEQLPQALLTDAPCAVIKAQASAVTGEFTERVTLGLRALLSIERLVLLITGDAKWQVYQQALTNPEPATTPVSYLLQQDTVAIDVFWCP